MRLLTGTLTLAMLMSHHPAFAQSPALARIIQTTAPDIVGSGNAAADYIYKIGPEDRLQITINGEDDLSGEYRVRPDGRIALPLLGDLVVTGLSTDQIARKLEQALSDLMTTPRATVMVIAAGSTYQDRIRLIGDAFPAPRTLPYRQGLTSLGVLTEIGGLPETAAANRARIIRTENGRTQKIRLRLGDIQSGRALGADTLLQPGDVIYVPESFFAGSRTIEMSVGAAQSYSDNINLQSGDLKRDSAVSELFPAIRIDYDTARLQALLDAEIRLQHRTNDDDSFSVAPEVQGSLNTELIERLFFLDSAVSISRQLVDTRRGQSSSITNIANTQVVQTYQISPYLRHRLGDLATMELRYESGLVLISEAEIDPLNPIFFNGQQGTDTWENTGSLILRSPVNGSKLNWSLTGSFAHFDQSERENRERTNAIAELTYDLTSSFRLIARGGYQKFTGQTFDREIDDPLYMAGFRWQPSDRTSFEFTAGQRDGNTAFNATFLKMIGQDLQFTASFNENVRIDQERLLDNLPGTPGAVDPTLPPDLPFSLRNNSTKNETASLNLSGQLANLFFVLTGSWQRNEINLNTGTTNEESLIARINLSQPLSRHFTARASGSFTERDFSAALLGGTLPREDRDYRATAGLDYTGFERLLISLSYGFSTRDSSLGIQDFTENTVTLSARLRL
ncbi:putative polysaccharide export protein wza [alpha proteobacterium Q-1]|nr:putative polysaccharide export protein wza [alpha proteobacterium Q-1]